MSMSDYISWKWIFAFSIFFFSQEGTRAQLRDKSVISADYEQCIDRSGGITSNILNCLGVENKRLDVVLNKTYLDIYHSLPKNNGNSLEREQKAWNKKTRRRCEQDPYMAMFEGGSYTTIIYSECFLEQRVARIEWLKARRAERY